MKKIAIILLALLPAMVGWSQDTVENLVREGYYYNNLPDLKNSHMTEWVELVGNKCGIETKEMYVEGEEPLKVYGVAAVMMTQLDLHNALYNEENDWNDFISMYGDTSLVNAYEYLGLYLRSGDSLQVQQEKKVHRKYDTPAYYVSNFTWGSHTISVPMYEKYFDSSVVVTDTFYIGVTQRSLESGYFPEYMGFSLLFVYGDACNGFFEYHVYKYCHPEEGLVYWQWPITRVPYGYCEYYMIFPILTPEPEPGDTLAVTQADMMARYVSVQPNPAVKEARVLSGFGLTRIEAYDDRGRLVLAREASGLEAVLDIAAWPRGTYLLRIATPMGTVTKKLLVK